ncbi:MAG: hypothetical protein M3421_14050, partial [Bacteroidota bacterium]|nr:hypothetical protein [Bacteroidota bacterium]
VPYSSSTSRSWERGTPKQIQNIFENNRDIDINSNEFNFNLPAKKTVVGRKSVYLSCASGYVFATTRYSNTSRPLTLTKQTNEIIDHIDPLKKMVMIKEYGYDSDGNIIKISEYDNSRPTLKYTLDIKYPNNASYYYSNCDSDLNTCRQSCSGNTTCENNCTQQYNICKNPPSNGATAAIHFLKDKHIITPIETISWFEKGSSKIFKGATINTFVITGSQFVVPKESFILSKTISSYTPAYVDKTATFRMSSEFKKVKSFIFNSTTGNLTSETGFNDITTSYTYGHNNTLVTQVQSNSGINSSSGNFTHKPLVGVLSESDPNGRFSYTEYDALNRPKIKKDHDGNILSRVRYHYKGEKPNFSFTSNKSQALTAENINFNISDVLTTSGTSTFQWNMGDGTTYTDNRTSVTNLMQLLEHLMSLSRW